MTHAVPDAHPTRGRRHIQQVAAALLGLIIGTSVGRLLLIWLALSLHGG